MLSRNLLRIFTSFTSNIVSFVAIYILPKVRAGHSCAMLTTRWFCKTPSLKNNVVFFDHWSSINPGPSCTAINAANGWIIYISIVRTLKFRAIIGDVEADPGFIAKTISHSYIYLFTYISIILFQKVLCMFIESQHIFTTI